MKLSVVQAPDTTEQFWQLVEQHHGEVLAFSLARIISYTNDDILPNKQPKHWGITYITRQGLYFHHFAKSTMLSNLFAKETHSNNEFCIHISFDNIEYWHNIAPTRSFFKLFQKDTAKLIIKGNAQIIKSLSSPANATTTEHTQGIVLNTVWKHAFFLDFQGEKHC